jgi:hypothetical protein|tara:strand:+ start:324 stop:434 length:111 start_codon:yes stop_codon:yes gene_type:complete
MCILLEWVCSKVRSALDMKTGCHWMRPTMYLLAAVD